MNKWAWAYVVGVYWMTLLVSMPFSGFFHKYRSYVSHNTFLYYLNRIFIEEYGYVIFSVGYISFAARFASNRRELSVHGRKYALLTVSWAAFNVWCFGVPIFERVNVLTGGHCEIRGNADGTLSMYQCGRTADGVWVDGFDPSGHLYFISTVSLALWREVMNLGHIHIDWEAQLVSYTLGPDDDLMTNNHSKIISTTSLVLIFIWYFEYCITCLFFHTIPEKIVGLLVATVVLTAYSYLDERLALLSAEPIASTNEQ